MYTVLEAVSSTRISTASLGVTRLVPLQKDTKITDLPNFVEGGLAGSPTGTSLTFWALTGLVVSALAFVGGIVVLVMYLHLDQKGREAVKTFDTGAERKGWCTLLRFRLFSGGRTHVDEEESSFHDSIYLDECMDRPSDNKKVLLHLDAGFSVADDRSVAESSYAPDYLLD